MKGARACAGKSAHDGCWGIFIAQHLTMHSDTSLAQAHAPAPVPKEHGLGGPSIMERFKRMAPPSFKRESQPLLAES
ncbi:hypothetical protein Taro_040534 [Colocasia esculenta]|uniref:Uncharacterized protein n=1 Tax=Colocasia esculenta TaxID=4460 RepID=A0A843WC43_COLES|nr:hypothetical protein [Colocasia esculenta]